MHSDFSLNDKEVLSLQIMIPSKRFDIFPPGPARRVRQSRPAAGSIYIFKTAIGSVSSLSGHAIA